MLTQLQRHVTAVARLAMAIVRVLATFSLDRCTALGEAAFIEVASVSCHIGQ